MTLREFQNQFKFTKPLTGYVGVERENTLVQMNSTGVHGHDLVPRAAEVLAYVDEHGIPLPSMDGNYWSGTPRYFTRHEPKKENEFGYELSACQIESRIGPTTLTNLKAELTTTENRLKRLLAHFHLKPGCQEVAPADMPLDVYPDPTGRYPKIVKRLSKKELLAGCRVIGTHIHIGMPDPETALHVYNFVIKHCEALCELGNGSFGERLAIYRQMAPNWDPMQYGSWQTFYNIAREQGFAEDPRKCWTLIRISVHGTIEFRMFGATDSVERIVQWARRCHELCSMAMATA